MKTSRVQRVLLHVTGCLLFLSLPVLFSPESLPLNDYLRNPPTQLDFVFYGWLILVFYGEYYLFIPRLFFPKRYVLFSLVTAALFALIISLPDPGGGWRRPPPPVAGERFREDTLRPAPFFPVLPETRDARMPVYAGRVMDIQRRLFLFLAVIFISLLLRVRDLLKMTEKEKMLTELAFLKAQINPHFLFNSLNTIYSLALEKSDQAPRAVVKLSDMMRYVLEDAGSDGVLLFQEIDHLKNYIALQQIRFGDSVSVDLQMTGVTENFRIAPLLLIPFVENAFMHGVSPESPSTIRIRLQSVPGEFRMEVYNRKQRSVPGNRSSGGVGLSNVKRRLALFYPERHRLNITENDVDFTAGLTLRIP